MNLNNLKPHCQQNLAEGVCVSDWIPDRINLEVQHSAVFEPNRLLQVGYGGRRLAQSGINLCKVSRRYLAGVRARDEPIQEPPRSEPVAAHGVKHCEHIVRERRRSDLRRRRTLN